MQTNINILARFDIHLVVSRILVRLKRYVIVSFISHTCILSSSFIVIFTINLTIKLYSI